MNILIKSKVIYFLLIVLPNLSFSDQLSQASKRVKIAWEELNKNPNSKQKQLAYLNAFPGNKKEFTEIFDQANFSQLYDNSYQFITSFIKLSKYYPVEIINKSINIGKDLTYDADATGFLQHYIVQLGVENTRIFSDKLNSLPKTQTNHLITFLADVENHKAYPEYQQLIALLNKASETELANEFIGARFRREKVKNH